MSLKMLSRRVLRLSMLLALAGIPLGAAASPEVSLGFSPAGIPISGTTRMVVTLRTTSFQLMNASATLTYPGLVNIGTFSNGCMDNAATLVVASAGTSTATISPVNLTSSFACNVVIDVAPTTVGTTTVTALPGSFVDPNPANGPSLGTATATLCVTADMIVTSAADSGAGTLRDIITAANASCPADIDIKFNIPGPGPHVIRPASQLPAFATAGAVSIDGTTQPPVDGAYRIELDGSDARCVGCSGLVLPNLWSATVNGLAIHSFQQSGIEVRRSAAITGNLIGMDASGLGGAGNGYAGIRVLSGAYANVQNGGSGPNLIAGNAKGVVAEGTAYVFQNVFGRLKGGAARGNGSAVFIAAGGDGFIIENEIANSTGAGIVVDRAAVEADIARNRTTGNALGGIDLNNDGPTPNDEDDPAPYDTDGGANGTLNYPVFAAIFNGVDTVVTGRLRAATGGGGVKLEFFSNAAPGLHEGATFIASAFPTFDAAGGFTVTLPGAHANISATASVDTCSEGCYITSEYSASVAVRPPGPAITLDASTLSLVALAGTPSVEKIVNLTNSGNAALTFVAPRINVTGPFSVADDCPVPPATLGPGLGCKLRIVFNAPATTGAIPGTVTFSSDAVSPASLALTGESMAAPEAVIVAPASASAGSTVRVGLRVRNPNSGGLAVSGRLGLNPAFSITGPIGGTCGGEIFGGATSIGSSRANVAGAAECVLAEVDVVLPATPGRYQLQVAAGDLMVLAPYVSASSAAVIFFIDVTAPTLTVTPTTLSFGGQDIGSPSVPQTVTLTNPGSVPVAIASIVASGDFASQTACPKSLPKGASCTVDVKFLPTTAGARKGALVIDASGVTYSVALGGTGSVPLAPAISVGPGSLSFANRTLGTVSPAQAVTVTNSGTAPLSISSVAVSGDYAFTSACPAALPVGATCSVAVKFTPLVVGNRAGNLTISTNAPGSPTVVALSGVGVDVPVGTLEVSPQSLDFGAHPVGVTTPPQMLEVANVGSATVFILDLGLTGDFAFGDTPATARACGGALPAGERCVLALVFRPTASGGRGGNLRIRSDGTNFAADVGLSGFGVAVVPQRALEVQSALTFGPQPFGTRSDGISLTIANRSSAPVTMSDIDADGDFSVTESCTVIPARGTCVATVFFSPTARGTRSGTLTIRIQSEPQPYLVALSGEGAANPVPILSLTPTRIGFGNTFIGSVSDIASVTLTNQGEAPLLLDDIAAPGDFLIEDRCGALLAAGASCTIDVRFFPRMLDVRGGSLEVRSNAAGSPHFVALSGTGCSIPNVGRSRIPQLLCGK